MIHKAQEDWSKHLRTDTYRINQKTNSFHVLEDIEKRENGSKEVKRKFVRTENKIKDIIFTNTHRKKTNVLRKEDTVNISIRRKLFQHKMSNFFSKNRAVEYFIDYTEEKGINN